MHRMLYSGGVWWEYGNSKGKLSLRLISGRLGPEKTSNPHVNDSAIRIIPLSPYRGSTLSRAREAVSSSYSARVSCSSHFRFVIQTGKEGSKCIPVDRG